MNIDNIVVDQGRLVSNSQIFVYTHSTGGGSTYVWMDGCFEETRKQRTALYKRSNESQQQLIVSLVVTSPWHLTTAEYNWLLN